MDWNRYLDFILTIYTISVITTQKTHYKYNSNKEVNYSLSYESSETYICVVAKSVVIFNCM